jgi:hypothetical protein
MPRDLKRMLCLMNDKAKTGIYKSMFINAAVSFEDAKKKQSRGKDEPKE